MKTHEDYTRECYRELIKGVIKLFSITIISGLIITKLYIDIIQQYTHGVFYIIIILIITAEIIVYYIIKTTKSVC